MKQTDKVPKIPLEQFKRTKIIATVGPSTNTYESILSLLEAGVNGIRLNFSHGTHEERVPTDQMDTPGQRGLRQAGGYNPGPARAEDTPGRL